jgi:hypothetical protein
MATKLTATGITFPSNDVLAGVATQSQATTGTDDTVAMTPLKMAQAIAATASRYQSFTASGTWTKPTDISADYIVTVEAWGAGGGGGCERGTASSTGGGGGGGGYTIRRFRLGDLPATVAVGVGAGGAGAGSFGNGGAGGDSTFGALVTAYGGNGGGYDNSNVSVGNALAGTLFGRAAGTGTDYFSGGSGSDGEGVGFRAYMGGGGGGGANAARAENSYAGGASVGGGRGGNGIRMGDNPPIASEAGSAPGGGGGGSADEGGLGAAGARGEVRVWITR